MMQNTKQKTLFLYNLSSKGTTNHLVSLTPREELMKLITDYAERRDILYCESDEFVETYRKNGRHFESGYPATIKIKRIIFIKKMIMLDDRKFVFFMDQRLDNERDMTAVIDFIKKAER